MKKKISGILVIMMSISLCFGCGNDSDKKEKTSESIVSSSLQDDSINESSEESTTESVVESTLDNTSEQETTIVNDTTTSKEVAQNETTSTKKEESTTEKQETTTAKKEQVTVCNHSYVEATCTEPAKCKKCGVTKGNALNHNYVEATCKNAKTCNRCGTTEGMVLSHKFNNGECVYCGEEGGTVSITIDNWEKYFEVYDEVDWNLNAFGEPVEFKGINIVIGIKDEYKDKCIANISFEYQINQGHCDVQYDVKNKKCVIGKQTDVYNEHTSTWNLTWKETTLAFSLGDFGTTTGSCNIEKYTFVKMLRIQGTLDFLN